MKHKIERTNPSTKRFSTRTIAMVLSIVMLIGSIATGSMLSTFAAYIKDNAAKTDAIADAVSEGSAIAESAIPSEDADAPAQADDADEKPDLSGFEENEIVRKMKDDLASTGAKADLASTGWSTLRVPGDFNDWSTSDDSKSFELISGTKYEFKVYATDDGGKWFSASKELPFNTEYVAYQGWQDNMSIKPVYGNVTFTVSSDSANTKVKATDTAPFTIHYGNSLNNENSTVSFKRTATNTYTATATLEASKTYYLYVKGTNNDYYRANNTITSLSTRSEMWKYDNNNSNHSVKIVTTSAGQYTFTWTWGNDHKYLDVEYPTSTEEAYYLTGLLNGSSESGETHKFTKGTGDNWTYTFTPSGDEGGYQYMTIKKSDGTVYHANTLNAGSGTAASATTDTDTQADNKWRAAAVSGQTVTFTWNTTGAAPVLSWTVAGSGSSGTLTPYKVLYGTGPNVTQLKVMNGVGVYQTGTNEYTVNFSSVLGTTLQNNGEYYIAISKSDAYTGILGGGVQNSGNDGTCEIKEGNTYFATAQIQSNNSTVNGTNWKFYYAHIKLINNPSGLKFVVTNPYNNSDYKVDYDYYASATAYSEEGGGDTAKSVVVYAKDGAINNSSTSQTYASIANTKIYKANGTTAAGTNTTVTGQQSYETYTAKKGETVVIKTTIGHNATGGNLSNATALRSKYYVRGFCINGEVPELLIPNTTTGEYTLTYKVPEDYEGGAIEITPIYYLASTTNPKVVTFRINGFTDDLKEVGVGKPNWGNTLYAYPFYGNLGGYNNAFGSYPGQPLVYNNGQYQIQVPSKSTAWELDENTGSDGTKNHKGKTLDQVNDTNVSGITMSNGYYDIVHKTVMGYGDNSASADHVQTYDYGDFYKIFNEKDPDNIVFEFKYKTKKHNLEDDTTGAAIAASTLTSKYGSSSGNGFEPLKNYHGKNVDLFGTALSGDAADPTKTPPVYVVSIGGVNGSSGIENVAGYYASAWRVYVPNDKTSTYTTYKKITSTTTELKNSIPPEVLILNDSTKFNNTTYPSADSDYSITDWQAMYQTLEAYRGLPVYISYEAADAQIGAKNYAVSGSGGATRNDGRWLYSSKGENITSSIKIQYSNDNGVSYTDLDTASPKVSGLSAYFTNSEAYGEQTYATTIDADKTFDFEASTTNANYMFVGWYFDNGIKITTDNVGSTERSGSYTLVARFMKVTAGQLILQHSTNTDNTYKGAGTSKIAVQVTDAENTVLTSYETADTITIPKKYITNTHLDYKIKVTLTSTPTGYDTYGTTSLDTTESSVTTAKFFNIVSTTTSGNVTTKTFEFTVGDLFSGSDQVVNSLLYNSYYSKTTFNYDITFNYTGRKINTENANRSYKRSGTLTPAQVTSYVTKSGSTYTLNQDFITTLAPHESNFNETLVWTLSNVTSGTTSFTKSYTATVATTGTNIRSAARTATFDMGKGGATVNYNVTFGQLIKNGDNYITADPMYNGQYFQYWRIQTANADPAKRIDVAKCYSNDFNYLAYDNYYITAVYDETPFSYGSDGASASISYLDTTRNQWNNGGNGGYTTSVAARNTASDLLFNDFALAYGYNGNRLYEDNNAVAGNAVEVGFVVERIRNLDIKQDGSYDTDVSKYIASGTDAATAKTNATAAINNITVSGYGAANGTGAYKTFTKYKLDRTKLDNKNRIEFFYALYNAYGGGTDGTGTGTDGDYWKNFTYKNYVYRAYSYIKVGNTLTVTDDPAYFIMYDEATK